jgi:hypothetical protein
MTGMNPEGVLAMIEDAAKKLSISMSRSGTWASDGQTSSSTSEESITTTSW